MRFPSQQPLPELPKPPQDRSHLQKLPGTTVVLRSRLSATQIENSIRDSDSGSLTLLSQRGNFF